LVAGNDLSFYTFKGLKPSANETLHLTSHRFDEPLAMEAVSSAHRVLAIHGERSPDEVFVMVGGLWEEFRDRLTYAFERAGIPVQSPREGLEGIHPENICNRGRTGAGGQLEISEGLRQRLREDEGMLLQFVEIVRRGLLELDAEMRGGRHHAF
jgi:phage replication-related protein YjqB (UPF0714/DUF867 family)